MEKALFFSQVAVTYTSSNDIVCRLNNPQVVIWKTP